MSVAPSEEPIANATPRAERPDDLRLRRWREPRECRAHARETGGSFIANPKRDVHALETNALSGDEAGHRARAPFASCASTTCRKKGYG